MTAGWEFYAYVVFTLSYYLFRLAPITPEHDRRFGRNATLGYIAAISKGRLRFMVVMKKDGRYPKPSPVKDSSSSQRVTVLWKGQRGVHFASAQAESRRTSYLTYL